MIDLLCNLKQPWGETDFQNPSIKQLSCACTLVSHHVFLRDAKVRTRACVFGRGQRSWCRQDERVVCSVVLDVHVCESPGS